MGSYTVPVVSAGTQPTLYQYSSSRLISVSIGPQVKFHCREFIPCTSKRAHQPRLLLLRCTGALPPMSLSHVGSCPLIRSKQFHSSLKFIRHQYHLTFPNQHPHHLPTPNSLSEDSQISSKPCRFHALSLQSHGQYPIAYHFWTDM